MLSSVLLISSVNAFAPPMAVPHAGLAASRVAVAVMSADIKVKQQWVAFEAVANIPPDTIGSGFQNGLEIAIANVEGNYYALANKLPPTGQPATFATLGKIQGKRCINDPVSGTSYDLKTGKVVGDWCPSLVGKLLKILYVPADVPIFPCRKVGAKIEVQIDVNAKAKFESQYWRGVLDAQGKVDGGYY